MTVRQFLLSDPRRQTCLVVGVVTVDGSARMLTPTHATNNEAGTAIAAGHGWGVHEHLLGVPSVDLAAARGRAEIRARRLLAPFAND